MCRHVLYDFHHMHIQAEVQELIIDLMPLANLPHTEHGILLLEGWEHVYHWFLELCQLNNYDFCKIKGRLLWNMNPVMDSM